MGEQPKTVDPWQGVHELLAPKEELNPEQIDKRLAALEERIIALEEASGIAAPTHDEMYHGDTGFFKFKTPQEQAVWELNERLERIENGGKNGPQMLESLSAYDEVGSRSMVYRPQEHTVSAQLERIEARIAAAEKGETPREEHRSSAEEIIKNYSNTIFATALLQFSEASLRDPVTPLPTAEEKPPSTIAFL